MMARSTHNGPALDVDQAAVTDLQPNQPPEPDPALTPGTSAAAAAPGGIVHLKLHLTDDTQLRAHGFLTGGELVAEVHWDFPFPGTRLGEAILWGTPAMLRRLAELAVQAAIQAEEEAAWQAHTARTTPTTGAQVA